MKDSGNIEIRVLGSTEYAVLENVAPDVFDNPIDPRYCTEFLADPRHHIVVALASGRVIGMASAVHYVHPDKAPELWINEVGVAHSYRGQGIGKRLLRALLDYGFELGCTEAWVLTEQKNVAAKRLYVSIGGKEEVDEIAYFSFTLEKGE